jgi:hypothetical protein
MNIINLNLHHYHQPVGQGRHEHNQPEYYKFAVSAINPNKLKFAPYFYAQPTQTSDLHQNQTESGRHHQVININIT